MIPLQTLHFHLFNYNADSTIRSIPTYIAFIYSIDQSLLISFIYSIDQKKVLREIYLGVAAVAEEEAGIDGHFGHKTRAQSSKPKKSKPEPI
jgi:hypothetical protein